MVDLLKDAVAFDRDEEMDPRNHEQLEQMATNEGADRSPCRCSHNLWTLKPAWTCGRDASETTDLDIRLKTDGQLRTVD